MQVPSIDMLTQVIFTSKWISGCYADHAVENTFLAAQPIQLIALTVNRHSSWWCSDSGGHSKEVPSSTKRSGMPRSPPSFWLVCCLFAVWSVW